VPDGLRLEVTEYTDLSGWRWVLTDANGAFLADHEVRLDQNGELFGAFTALHDYVSWHAAPDKRSAEEIRIVTGLGDWIGTEVFGAAIGSALLTHRPATVEVILPAGAEEIAYLPLEAARIESRPLAGNDITLVIRPAAARGTLVKVPATDKLRVLGLFSLPEGGTALNLRRERQSLLRLVQGIAASGRAADVKALQYGVTRGKLRGILAEGEGWDIIHISGHGVPGEFVLETADGRPDRISAADLADLLGTARARVKLVTVSACWSAALATAEPRRRLGLPAQENQRHYPPERTVASPLAPRASGDIATTLASRLGCAVLAMRFPVSDEFAIELSTKLYELLADKGQPLPSAVRMTVKHLAARPVEEWFPALSMSAPAIFGATATELTLTAPKRTAPVSYAAEHPKLARFPPQPDRFVGRTAVMTRASAFLAVESGIPGVLLHGMPGGGKTACALELAHTHEDAFDKLIWFKAPDESTEISGSLTDFALALGRDLPGFQMIDNVVTEEALTAFLPMLTELMDRNRLLLVIDNAESLLTDTGRWCDAQWGKVIAALTGHDGLGRLIMTSRRVPAGALPVRVEAVDALTADEALLLARELPHLNNLIYGNLPGIDRGTSRNLALGVLNVAQGHPKLLELANGQAAHPEQLAALVQAGGQAWQEQGELPGGFFATGEASAAPEDYLRVLAAWTTTVTDALSLGERDLFWFLCCLEEPDRIRPVLDANWVDLWQGLGRNGQPPCMDQSLAALAAHGLAAIRETNSTEDESYTVHPGIAAAARDQAGHSYQAAVDAVIGPSWYVTFWDASKGTDESGVDTALMVRAGLAAIPYLLRQEQWTEAAALIERAFSQNPSRTNATAVLPALQQIIQHDPVAANALGHVLTVLDPATAETLMRTYLNEAITLRNYRSASAIAARLTAFYRKNGLLAEALTLAEQATAYIRQAGLGPWEQLYTEAQRLMVLNETGHASQALSEVQRLLSSMDIPPASYGADDAVAPWNAVELLLDAGQTAALMLREWDSALGFTARRVASLSNRQASAGEIARVRFNDYGPLLSLGRSGEALNLLLDCRQIFDDARDIEMLGKTFAALAATESMRGHHDAAIRLQRDALRHAYQSGDMTTIATNYNNLGSFQRRIRGSAAVLASHLASALIRALIGIGSGPASAASSIRNAANDLREVGADAELPANVADLCRRIGDIPGTDPAALIAKLSPDPQTAERTLQDLINQAQKLAREAE
jgi:tetratricopeptide (TPR) repeat protein